MICITLSALLIAPVLIGDLKFGGCHLLAHCCLILEHEIRGHNFQGYLATEHYYVISPLTLTPGYAIILILPIIISHN